jgi:crotonobetainyl-CoA:carnitine CoA-transferase CaiB-like acyl-CoA transferase
MTATGHGALAGIKVIDLTRILGGPYCTQMLGDHGAEIIKIEPPQGDDTRRWGPPFKGETASYFIGVNRNKRGVALDLSKPEGREVLFRLLETADVLVENFKTGTLERWGMGYEAVLKTRFPRLVHCRVSGFGADGKLGGLPGYDAILQSMTGLMSVNGEPEGAPVRVGVPVVDLATGMNATIAILLALMERQRSGEGQVVDAAIVDGAAHLGTMFFGMLAGGVWSDRREANLLDGGTPYYCVYETRDRRHLAVGPLEEEFYDEFAAVVGLGPDAPDRHDRTQWPRLRETIAARLRSRDRDAWMEAFEGTDACVAPVLSLAEAPRHPHLAERETFVDVDGLVQPAPAPRFSRTPSQLGSSAAGADADPVRALERWGIAEAATLVENGVVAAATGPEGA